MKTKIETYRGWDIQFDTNTEEFYAISNEYDKDIRKKSYSSTKKYIDDYIKDNLDFKPVFAININAHSRKIKIIGIRKDGAFIYEYKDVDKRQLSTYDERDYILENPDNDYIFERIDELEKQQEKIRLAIIEARGRLIKTPISTIRAKYLKP